MCTSAKFQVWQVFTEDELKQFQLLKWLVLFMFNLKHVGALKNKNTVNWSGIRRKTSSYRSEWLPAALHTSAAALPDPPPPPPGPSRHRPRRRRRHHHRRRRATAAPGILPELQPSSLQVRTDCREQRLEGEGTDLLRLEQIILRTAGLRSVYNHKTATGQFSRKQTKQPSKTIFILRS